MDLIPSQHDQEGNQETRPVAANSTQTPVIQMGRRSKGKGRKPGARWGRKTMMKAMYSKPKPETPVESDTESSHSEPEPEVPLKIQNPIPNSQMPNENEKWQKTKRKKQWRERRRRKEAGRSAGPLDVLATSKAKHQMPQEEVDTLGDSGTLDPHSVLTTQSTATSRFSDGRSVMKTVSALKKHKKAKARYDAGDTDTEPEELGIPPIKVTRQTNPTTGKQSAYTLDNRRLYAYRRAGVGVPYELSESNAANKDFNRKFTSKDGGKSMDIIPDRSERVPYTHEDLYGPDSEDESGYESGDESEFDPEKDFM